ncbi:hypothetical protein AB0B40_00345 [Streptomyces sp. NPDC042638]|uniref:hypothetical protein n=1 Tax=Streptomyces sp. NPDC042638 TaxID=3154333 RepID=UPI0034044736
MRKGTDRADTMREYGLTLAKALEQDPYPLAPLKLHYLRWVLFGDDTRFMYQGIFDTPPPLAASSTQPTWAPASASAPEH